MPLQWKYFSIDIVIDKGPTVAQACQLNIDPFTLIRCDDDSVRESHFAPSWTDGCGVGLRVDYYSSEDLFHIINRSASILGVEINDDGAMELAKRSRGTPRIANRILRRSRDFAQIKASGKIDLELAEYALKKLGIDKIGLDLMDRKILEIIIDKFSGGPVGLKSLSVAIGEDISTIEEVYEPFLIKEGLIMRTPRGRVAQKKHIKY